ncbi:OmpA family protein [Marinobacter sp. 1Y8]
MPYCSSDSFSYRPSQSFNSESIQSATGFARRIATGATGVVFLAIMAGCATDGGTDTASTSQSAATTQATPVAAQDAPGPHAEPAAPAQTDAIDQSPIAATTSDDNSETKTDDRIVEVPKDEDMTVLVLDNPELLARAAQINAISTQQVDAMADSPRKPHRMKFHFAFDKHRLSDEDKTILVEHAAYLKAHPEVSVRINGHTDSHGADEYNEFLSRLRANTAAKILKAEGIDEKRIEVVGWGNHKPLTNPEDSAANRRLELEYLSEQMARAQ